MPGKDEPMQQITILSDGLGFREGQKVFARVGDYGRIQLWTKEFTTKGDIIMEFDPEFLSMSKFLGNIETLTNRLKYQPK